MDELSKSLLPHSLAVTIFKETFNDFFNIR